MKRILKNGVAVILALMCVMNFMVMIASAATVGTGNDLLLSKLSYSN